MSATKVVLFCGGRGSATIIRAFLRRTDVELTLLVNAYDDGLSTGALRDFIPGMLGPSDFRKNLSYLLGNYSGAQYALKSLMEYRLPGDGVEILARFVRDNDPSPLDATLRDGFTQLPPALSARLRALLGRFFDHASGGTFDYRDCSLGNLVFAGAYLMHGDDFNAAAAEICDLVSSRARLLNVSGDQNRILVGLKQDGRLLACEAEIVGAQSPVPIADLYLLEKPLSQSDIQTLAALDTAGRQSFLAARNAVPAISPDAAEALAHADIVLYGPGTQHSSLLPSYRIAQAALAASPAPVKALVINLDSDNDIQGLSASDLVDRALAYGAPVSDILLDDAPNHLPHGALTDDRYRSANISRASFSTPFRPQVHNGSAVVEAALKLHADAPPASVEIFADIHNRSVASEEIVEEFLETDWHGLPVHLTLNHVVAGQPVAAVHLDGMFPDSRYFRDWLAHGSSDILVLMTGDGGYRFRDIQAILALLERQPSLGAVFGSRTQSRRQFITSIQAAYGEHRVLYGLGKVAAFFLSTLFYLRTGVIVSDPLTGLRVFRRRSLAGLPQAGNDAPLAIARQLIQHGVEVAELPVLYRTFSGFTDPHWRVRRGLRNLMGLL